MARVFVSHASKDRPLADEVHGWLAGDGHEVFLNPTRTRRSPSVTPGSSGCTSSSAGPTRVVCLVTSAYLASPWCTAEVGVARSHLSRTE
jgi:TIR domain